MSLNHIEQQVYDAADAGNAVLIHSLLATNPSGTVDLNKRNPNAVGSVSPLQVHGWSCQMRSSMDHDACMLVARAHILDDIIVQRTSGSSTGTCGAWSQTGCERIYGMETAKPSAFTTVDNHSCVSQLLPPSVRTHHCTQQLEVASSTLSDGL